MSRRDGEISKAHCRRVDFRHRHLFILQFVTRRQPDNCRGPGGANLDPRQPRASPQLGPVDPRAGQVGRRRAGAPGRPAAQTPRGSARDARDRDKFLAKLMTLIWGLISDRLSSLSGSARCHHHVSAAAGRARAPPARRQSGRRYRTGGAPDFRPGAKIHSPRSGRARKRCLVVKKQGEMQSELKDCCLALVTFRFVRARAPGPISSPGQRSRQQDRAGETFESRTPVAIMHANETGPSQLGGGPMESCASETSGRKIIIMLGLVRARLHLTKGRRELAI